MWRLLVLVGLGLVAAPAADAAAATSTGRLLVTLRHSPAADSSPRATARAVVALAAARRAGVSVPQIGLVTLRPRPGGSLRALAGRLRADPRIAWVETEHRAQLRYHPNDPALTAPETALGTAPGTPVQWWAPRSGFPEAWDVVRGTGATVAVIDTGAEAAHPELAGRIAGGASFDATALPPTVDTVGHGTHVASVACAAADNGVGLAGAGLGCRLLIVKSDFTGSSIAAAIVWAVDHGAHAVNMSFGTEPGLPLSRAVRRAVEYARGHDVVLVAAAADDPVEDQGYPASILQPTGTGARPDAGSGLTVTAADFSDRRAPFAGRGSQISMAGYGAYDQRTGPPGIFGAFTTSLNQLDVGVESDPRRPPCRCRTTFGEDPRYAYLQGTSVAAPMVAAAGALVRRLNPDLSADRVIALLKQTARRPPGQGWTPDLGWGVLDAGAAVRAAQGVDGRRPSSSVRRLPPRTRRTLITLRWSGRDVPRPGVVASGIARYELWRAVDGRRPRRLLATSRTSARLRLRRGRRYAFFTVAVDRAGNRERRPARPDARVSVSAGERG